MLGVFIYRRFLSTSLFELASLSTRLHAATRQRIVVVVADSQIFCDAGFHWLRWVVFVLCILMYVSWLNSISKCLVVVQLVQESSSFALLVIVLESIFIENYFIPIYFKYIKNNLTESFKRWKIRHLIFLRSFLFVDDISRVKTSCLFRFFFHFSPILKLQTFLTLAKYQTFPLSYGCFSCHLMSRS